MATLEYYNDLAQDWLGSLKRSATDPLSRPVPLLLAGTAGTLGAYYVYKTWRDWGKRLPPSPRGWPLLGNKLDLSEADMHLDCLRLQERDGLPDIFTLRLGPSKKLIILNTHAAMKDAFVTQGDLFAERPRNRRFEIMDLHDEIFLKPYADPTWNEGKMFVMSAMRSAGFGSGRSAEEKVLEQFRLLERHLEPKVRSGDPIDISAVMRKTTSNVILNLLCNKVYDLDDPELLERVKAIDNWYASFSSLYAVDLFSPMLFSLMFRGVCKKAKLATDEYKEFLRKEVDEHEATLDPNNPRDFIDIYLSKKKGPVDKELLVNTCFVFLPDGMDTVSAVISWVILYIVSHPETMKRIRQEVDIVTGGSRHVAWSDRPKIPYTEATIMEAVRVSVPFSFSTYHCPIRDCYYRGYFIPAGTPMLGNLYSAMMDEKNFKDPKTFNPDRFLDADGSVVKTDTWIPFGMGRRKCLGEQTTKIETLLLVANLFHRYDVSFPTDDPKPSLEPIPSLLRVPHPYKVVLKPRH